jgi:hypothetical protein
MKDSTRMATYDGKISDMVQRATEEINTWPQPFEQLYTKEDILRILGVITLDFLPDEYSPEVLETWLNDSIETLERMKRLSYNEQD